MGFGIRKGSSWRFFESRILNLESLVSESESGGGRWIRTTEGVSQQIYSLPPLAAWVSLRNLSCFVVATSYSDRPGGGLRRASCPPPLRGRAAFASRSRPFPSELGRTAAWPGQLHEFPCRHGAAHFHGVWPGCQQQKMGQTCWQTTFSSIGDPPQAFLNGQPDHPL
jgi:hypothetical protein